jgi:ethanolamine utilization protein EutA
VAIHYSHSTPIGVGTGKLFHDHSLSIQLFLRLKYTTGSLMEKRVKLIGLDVGSTTSSALIAEAKIARHSVTGKMDLSNISTIYQSEPVFTPFHDEQIDENKFNEYVEAWCVKGGIDAQDVFAGGVIITGLAAKAKNAQAITDLTRTRIHDCVIARADDPSLESWLAFMGSCSTLSRAHPNTPILNLDIGGGTTNSAVGLNGDVLNTGCFYIGARHFQFIPGTYTLCNVSEYGHQLLAQLTIDKRIGDLLGSVEIDTILDAYIEALEAIVCGNMDYFKQSARAYWQQVPFKMPDNLPQAVVTFSGGVGELIYTAAKGNPLPPTTYYGDMGIDLALRIINTRRLSKDVKTLMPPHQGRATVYGLALHCTEISGTTLFLPYPETLPLKDLPIIARLYPEDDQERINNIIDLARKSPRGAGVQLAFAMPDWIVLKTLGMKLKEAFITTNFPTGHPFVLFTEDNIGKTLGNYATDWGKRRINFIVIDEISQRDAQFVNIGIMYQQIIPISFYAIN